MNVGGDRVGWATLRDRGLGHRVVEAAATVAHIEQHAALLGIECGRQQPAVLDDVGEFAVVIRRARIAVREDVAGAQRLQDQRHQFHRLHTTDVAHDAAIGACNFAGPDRALERLDAMACDHVLRHAHLDADGKVGVLCERLCRDFGLREIDIEQFADRKRRQADVGDVHESKDPRSRLSRRVPAVGGEGARARVAGGHRRGGALVKHQLVGRDADTTGEDMRVQVDQTRNDEATCSIHDPIGPRRGDVGLKRFDAAVANADVQLSAQLLAGVEHVAALDDKVELVGRPHGSAGLGGHDPGCEHCTDTCDELPTIERGHGLCPRWADWRLNLLWPSFRGKASQRQKRPSTWRRPIRACELYLRVGSAGSHASAAGI